MCTIYNYERRLSHICLVGDHAVAPLAVRGRTSGLRLPRSSGRGSSSTAAATRITTTTTNTGMSETSKVCSQFANHPDVIVSRPSDRKPVAAADCTSRSHSARLVAPHLLVAASQRHGRFASTPSPQPDNLTGTTARPPPTAALAALHSAAAKPSSILRHCAQCIIPGRPRGTRPSLRASLCGNQGV